VHNLAFYLHLVQEARKHILQGNFAGWKAEQAALLKQRL
jgi:queuine tRNA-ribosyltransferase